MGRNSHSFAPVRGNPFLGWEPACPIGASVPRPRRVKITRPPKGDASPWYGRNFPREVPGRVRAGKLVP